MDVQDAWEMVLSVLPAIRRIAKGYAASYPGVDVDDFEHAGVVGAFMATRLYDPGLATFATYSRRWVIAYMGREARGGDSRRRHPGLDPRDARLEAPVGDDTVLGDLLPSPDDRRIDERIDVAVVANAGVRDLRPRERLVIERRAKEDSLESIATDLGISRARVYMIEKVARNKARRAIEGAIA